MAIYVTKQALMEQINKSKLSYSWDSLGPDVEVDGYALEMPPELEQFELLAEALNKKVEEIVIRVMTDSHVPNDAPPVLVITKRAQRKPSPTNFKPFRDFKYANNTLIEVRRSHWKGDLIDGHFSATHGRVTQMLLLQCQQIVRGILTKPNFRNYSFRDDMEADAMEKLFQHAIKFDESKSSNPFHYISTIATNRMIDTIKAENKERKGQKILRDEALTDTQLKQDFNFK